MRSASLPLPSRVNSSGSGHFSTRSWSQAAPEQRSRGHNGEDAGSCRPYSLGGSAGLARRLSPPVCRLRLVEKCLAGHVQPPHVARAKFEVPISLILCEHYPRSTSRAVTAVTAKARRSPLPLLEQLPRPARMPTKTLAGRIYVGHVRPSKAFEARTPRRRGSRASRLLQGSGTVPAARPAGSRRYSALVARVSASRKGLSRYVSAVRSPAAMKVSAGMPEMSAWPPRRASSLSGMRTFAW